MSAMTAGCGAGRAAVHAITFARSSDGLQRQERNAKQTMQCLNATHLISVVSAGPTLRLDACDIDERF